MGRDPVARRAIEDLAENQREIIRVMREIADRFGVVAPAPVDHGALPPEWESGTDLLGRDVD